MSRRHRRLFWSLGLLAAAGFLGIVLGLMFYRAHVPETYRPGEDSADITHDLDRYAVAAVSAGGVENAGGLRNLSHALPAGAPAPRFTDVTRQAGLGEFRSFAGNRTSQLPEDMGSGVAWGDFDNDGNEDVFVVSAGGALDLPASQLAPSMLFRNLGNGKFQKVENFPDTRIIGMAAAWADYNNDGWLDLVVTGYDSIILFRNEHGVLVRDEKFPSPKGFWTGAAWGDYDRDGDLDLYVCGYVKYKPGAGRGGSEQFGLEVPFTLNPASYEPERNLLFHNDGDGTFSEKAGKLGISNRDGRSLTALWHDFDGDGWLDLYVANDISENKLYLNKRGKFVDSGKSAWVGEYRGSMGLAAADFDRDGDDDLFISHWIAQQYALYQSLLSEQKLAAKQNGAGAAKSNGELHFTDVAEMRGIGQVSLQSIGWGTSFVDIDSDGWLDLVVANGSTFETKEAPRRVKPMPSFLFWSQKGEFFHDLAPWNASLSTAHASRGLAVADYNNDGAMDIAIVDHGEGVRLLRNDMRQGNWLELRLHNRVGGHKEPIGFGDGATVIAYAGGAPLRRTVSSSSYLSQDSRRVHFGLGKSAKADQVEVHWLDGRVDHYTALEANAIWDLTEADPLPRRYSNRALPPAALSRQQTVEFWSKQRAAMDAMKKERNPERAIELFRAALALDPLHEDSHYYLANCLYAHGDPSGALEQLDELIRINPTSHRAYLRKGAIQAIQATSRAQLAAAEESARKALALNSEETGALLLIGEIALAGGALERADRQFELACRTNPKAVGALFLRGYIAWKAKDYARGGEFLKLARDAGGTERKPKGSVSEGDVRARMHHDTSLVARYWDDWDGGINPDDAYKDLDSALRAQNLRLKSASSR